jgi:hypothetical protein
MKSIPAFSKQTTGGGIQTGGKTRAGFTPNVMVSKKIEPKPIKQMAAHHGAKSQIGGKTPGADGAPGSAGRKVHAARKIAAFSKKKI